MRARRICRHQKDENAHYACGGYDFRDDLMVAAEKAFKRVEEIFSKYPITQTESEERSWPRAALVH